MEVEPTTNAPPAKRLFVGLQIYGDQAIRLAAMSKEMWAQFAGAAGQVHLWEPDGTGHRHRPDSGGLDTVPYHISLQFLGPVDVSQVAALKKALEGVAAARPPFVLYLRDCHTFPDRSGVYPKIAWAGVSGQNHHLILLQRAVSKAMGDLGYEPPEHHFLPHVTVGRFDTDNRDWCLEMSDYWRNFRLSTGPFLVNEIVLYASERDEAGKVTYVIQDRWQLNSLLLA